MGDQHIVIQTYVGHYNGLPGYDVPVGERNKPAISSPQAYKHLQDTRRADGDTLHTAAYCARMVYTAERVFVRTRWST